MHSTSMLSWLYVRGGVALAEQMHGGRHQNGMRSGTLSTQQIAAFAKAVELLEQKTDLAKIESYRKTVVKSLSSLDGITTNNPRAKLC